jgi:SAM-dependent methyltransferase
MNILKLQLVKEKPYANDSSRKGSSLRAAKEIVPFLVELIQPEQVIDIGCGLGAWLSVFKELGTDKILGVDGDYVPHESLEIPVEDFLAHDLTKPLNLDKSFDLAISLEVAEHIPLENSEDFIDMLIDAAPVILFSAAIPHQPGESHINCQWPAFWANLFCERGYVLFDCLRVKFWQNPKVAWWYSQNMLLFVRQSHISNYPLLEHSFSHTKGSPMSIVHPEHLQNSVRLDSKNASLKQVLLLLARVLKRDFTNTLLR